MMHLWLSLTFAGFWVCLFLCCSAGAWAVYMALGFDIILSFARGMVLVPWYVLGMPYTFTNGLYIRLIHTLLVSDWLY